MDTYNPNHCQQSEPIQNILHKTVIGYHIYVKIQKLLFTMKKADEQVKKKIRSWIATHFLGAISSFSLLDHFF